MGLRMPPDTMRTILEDDWGLSPATTEALTECILADPDLRDAFTTWLQNPRHIPDVTIKAYRLVDVIEDYQLVPLHAFILLMENEPEAVIEARDSGELGPYPWVPEHAVRIYQAEHTRTVVGMTASTRGYRDVQLAEAGPAVELTDDDPAKLAELIAAAAEQRLDEYATAGQPGVTYHALAASSDALGAASQRWHIEWGAYDGEDSYVNILLERRADTSAWPDPHGLSIDDQRFLSPPVTPEILADWVLHGEETVKHLRLRDGARG